LIPKINIQISQWLTGSENLYLQKIVTKIAQARLSEIDRVYVQEAAQAGMAEVELAKLALETSEDENIKKYVCTLSPQRCYDQDRSSQDSSKPTNIESQGKKNKGYINTGPKQTQTATVMWEIFIQGC
jgi:hypothetical protein